MTLDLGNGKSVTVNAFREKVWITAYNGVGATLPLTKQAAIRLRASLLGAILELEEEERRQVKIIASERKVRRG